MNYFRLGNLPVKRAIRGLCDAKEWEARTYTVGRYPEDLGILDFAADRFSDVTAQSYDNTLENYSANVAKVKSMANIFWAIIVTPLMI